MCGVIVVDAGRSQSTLHVRDAYIHDHCLRYRHNYALFYQLLGSNLFTHHNIFSREATSEIYGPWVYLLSYFLLDLSFTVFVFRSTIQKTQKYLAAIYLYLL